MDPRDLHPSFPNSFLDILARSLIFGFQAIRYRLIRDLRLAREARIATRQKCRNWLSGLPELQELRLTSNARLETEPKCKN